MTKISLLEMGKIKRRNVRETIITILSREYPLSIKKIYNKVKKEHNLDVTYQAVFKIIKEMIEDNVIEKSDKEYKLNINWIKDLENELEIIKKNYIGKNEENKEPIQERVNSFISELGPKIKEYIGKDEACIVGVSSGGGIIFATALLRYLLKENIRVNYLEFDQIKESSKEKLTISKKEIKNKKVIIIDSSIYSGKTYNMIMEKFAKNKKYYNIKDIKYVADKDLIGLADFSRKH